MRFDLYAFHAALACIGMPLHAANPAGRFDISAERNEVLAQRRICRNGEGAMPEFAVKVFGVIAFNPLTGAEAHVDRTPGREEGGQRAHIGGWRAAAAKARRDPRIAGLVELTRGPGVVELGSDQIERLIPRDPSKARIFAASKLGLISVAIPSWTRTVSKSGPATHW